MVETLHQLVGEERKHSVTPTEAGVQNAPRILDSRFRGNDVQGDKNVFLAICC